MFLYCDINVILCCEAARGQRLLRRLEGYKCNHDSLSEETIPPVNHLTSVCTYGVHNQGEIRLIQYRTCVLMKTSDHPNTMSDVFPPWHNNIKTLDIERSLIWCQILLSTSRNCINPTCLKRVKLELSFFEDTHEHPCRVMQRRVLWVSLSTLPKTQQ